MPTSTCLRWPLRLQPQSGTPSPRGVRGVARRPAPVEWQRQSRGADVIAPRRPARATAFYVFLSVLLLGACRSADDTDTLAAPTTEPSLAAHPGLSSYRSTRHTTRLLPRFAFVSL